MRVAFDARCKTGKDPSFTRVLDLWQHAADIAKLDYTNWDGGVCTADVLISPNSDIASVRGPLKVATLHDVNPLQPQPSSWLKRAPAIHKLKKVARNLQLNADFIFTVSDFAKNEIARAFPALGDKLFVVPNYPSPVFSPGPADQQLLRQCGLPNECVLFVSAIRKHKNWQGLLTAWQQVDAGLRAKHPLVFVASRKKINSKLIGDDVVFTEHIDDSVLTNLYRSAKVMVFPSFAEGFGLPPVEALACHCPVISSSASCMPEILGNSVDYFDPLNVSALTELITIKLNNPKQDVVQPRPWSPEITANRLSDFLTSIKS
ncbi:MAG: glycosyltransferase family 1 protein [Planctomycetota bacterium]|nr:glycosyltransferase family 1 protein [Planctomycetota bacterium]